MTTHTSATAPETPHVTRTNTTIVNALRRRAQSVESIDFSQTPEGIEDKSSQEKIEALAEMICHGGDQSAAALLVLMATLQNAADPKVVANTAKHLAFTRCGELNVYGMVDAQIAMLESELLVHS